jgi:hypothetical protein
MGQAIIKRTPKSASDDISPTDLIELTEYLENQIFTQFSKYNPNEPIHKVYIEVNTVEELLRVSHALRTLRVRIITAHRIVFMEISLYTLIYLNKYDFISASSGNVTTTMTVGSEDIGVFLEEALTNIEFPGASCIRSQVSIPAINNTFKKALISKNNGDVKAIWNFIIEAYISSTPSHLAALSGLDTLRENMIAIVSGLVDA